MNPNQVLAENLAHRTAAVMSRELTYLEPEVELASIWTQNNVAEFNLLVGPNGERVRVKATFEVVA